MANSDTVFTGIKGAKNVNFSALVPNLRGFERAIEAGVKEISIFTSASESFSKKNTNCSIQESLARFVPVLKSAADKKIPTRAYISCIAGCPYEGAISPTKVAVLANELYQMGCYEVSLADTTGVGTPGIICQAIEKVSAKVPLNSIAGHFHDTYSQALVNIYAALSMGISIFDSSVSGLGGCPYVKNSDTYKAPGNVATEDLIYMLNGLNIKHDINLNGLMKAGLFISKKLGKKSGSKVSAAFT
jgi:hydroxymethylglutaryl-CoA lyase